MYTLTIYCNNGIEWDEYSDYKSLIFGIEERYRIAIRDNEVIKGFCFTI